MSLQAKSPISYIGLDYVTIGVCIIDKEFTIVFWNSRLEEWRRKKRDCVVGRKLWDVFHAFNSDKYKKRIESVFTGGPPVIFSSQLHPDLFQSRTSTGKRAIQKATVSALPLADGVFHALFSIEDVTALSHKISQYRNMRDVARKALEEKEVLLREMHHRIKNNLHMVTSLIDLKMANRLPDEDLFAIKNELNAIRLVHEKLYQSERVSTIRFKTFAEELIESIFCFSNIARPEVTVVSEDHFLESSSAIPIGLILNELASNALKHGFKADEQAGFSVSLEQDTTREHYILTVSNTGTPFPNDISIDNSETLGLRLITSLVEQIEGTIELHREPDTTFVIRFPINGDR